MEDEAIGAVDMAGSCVVRVFNADFKILEVVIVDCVKEVMVITLVDAVGKVAFVVATLLITAC